MPDSSFNPNNLLSLILDATDSCQDYQNICNYCGVDWAGRVIRVPADDFYESLNSDQIKSLRTFQNNLFHFFEHFDAAIHATTIKDTIGFNVIESVLFDRIAKNMEKKGWMIFIKMTRNFIDQLLGTNDNKNNKKSDNKNINNHAQSFNTVIVDNLCDGDLDKALKVVPSRELARQLGVSDQKLRREIYLARQRALKKRPFPKKLSVIEDVGSDEEDSDDSDNSFDNIPTSFNIPTFTIPSCASPVPTCASPLSSTSSSDYDHLESERFHLIESPLKGWQSWLNIDMIEL